MWVTTLPQTLAWTSSTKHDPDHTWFDTPAIREMTRENCWTFHCSGEPFFPFIKQYITKSIKYYQDSGGGRGDRERGRERERERERDRERERERDREEEEEGEMKNAWGEDIYGVRFFPVVLWERNDLISFDTEDPGATGDGSMSSKES